MSSTVATTTTTRSNTTSSSMPNKPLSAYNLFYRYKRAKIVESRGATKKAVCELVATPAGLENFPPSIRTMLPPDRLDDFRRTNVRLAMGQDLFSKNTKNRPHRKSAHGFKMSFVEMNRIMVASWKDSDEFTKGVFQELAQNGKDQYQKQLIEYSLGMYRDEKTKVMAMNMIASSSLVSSSIIQEETLKSQVQVQAPTLAATIASFQDDTFASTTKAKSPSESSKPDLTWEPLPFKNKQEDTILSPKTSSQVQASVVGVVPVSPALTKVVMPMPYSMPNTMTMNLADMTPTTLNHLKPFSNVVVDNNTHYRQQPSWPHQVVRTSQGIIDAASSHYTSPVSSKPCLPAFVTPTFEKDTISTTTTTMGNNNNNYFINNIQVSPGESPSFLPLPFLVGGGGGGNSRSISSGTESSNSSCCAITEGFLTKKSTQGGSSENQNSIESVDDFMQLIAVLGGEPKKESSRSSSGDNDMEGLMMLSFESSSSQCKLDSTSPIPVLNDEPEDDFMQMIAALDTTGC